MTLTANQITVARAMTHAEVDDAIRHTARLLGVYSYHTHRSQASEGGWPDWVLIGRPGIIYREVKRECRCVEGRAQCPHHPTSVQAAVLGMLHATNADADVWRPSDVLSGRVAREIASLGKLPGEHLQAIHATRRLM